MSAVYSPSSTTSWKRCPVLWQLGQQGIVKRELGKRDLAAALGSAFAQGMHVYNRARQAGVEPSLGPAAAALGQWIAQQVSWETEGRILLPQDESQFASVGRRLSTLVGYAIEHDPIPAEWQVVAVEESLGPNYGNARPDLVCRKPDGQLVVVDYKSTLSLNARTADERNRRLEMRKAEWRNSDQLFHYCWALKATHAVIVLAEVEPKTQLTMHDFWLPEEAIATWHSYQYRAWDRMEEHAEGLFPPGWRAAVHSDQFGECEMASWCFGSEVERESVYTTRTRSL